MNNLLFGCTDTLTSHTQAHTEIHKHILVMIMS